MTFYEKLRNYYARAYGMGHFPSLFEVVFSKKKKLIYYGFLGDGNYGDELVFMATKALFEKDMLIPYKKHMPIVVKALLSSNPNMVDGVIVGGGTLFRNFHGENDFYSKLAALKKSLFFHGTGADYDFKDYDFWKQLYATKTFGGVRGPLSKEHTKKRDIHLDIIGDAAFYLFDERLNIKTPTKTILINYGTHVYDAKLEKSRHVIENFLMSDALKDYTINYLPFHTNDLVVAEELISKHPHIKMLQIPTTLAEGLKHFNEAEFAIGERLHFNVMSVMANTPFISINYNLKHTDFLLSIKAEQFGYNPLDLEPEHLSRLFEGRHTVYNWASINSAINDYKNKMTTQYELFQTNITTKK